MKFLFAILLVVHAAIHLLGFAKAFDVVEVAQLKFHIPRSAGLVWLAASLSLTVAAFLLLSSLREWSTVALFGLVLSQAALLSDWQEAKYGTAVNLLALVPVVVALLSRSPSSYAARYESDVSRRLARRTAAAPVTEADLESLPPLVRTYLRRTNVVGNPHVDHVRARFSGAMRASEEGAWMKVEGEQVNFFDPPARYFLMHARRFGVPFDALHVLEDGVASMKVRALSLVPVVDAKGPFLNQSEAVTFFNDMCWLAPGALVRADVEWHELDARTVRATFTSAGVTIEADLSFDEDGDLREFRSGDRYQSADGKNYRRLTWSTLFHEYRSFGAVRIASAGEAIWEQPEQDFPYARFVLEAVEYDESLPNPSSPPLQDVTRVRAHAE